MTFSLDVNIATLIAIFITLIAHGVSMVVFVVRTNERTNGRANAAYELAGKALTRADEAHTALTLVNASISLVRETMARDYADREYIGAMEERLTKELHLVRADISELRDRRALK